MKSRRNEEKDERDVGSKKNEKKTKVCNYAQQRTLLPFKCQSHVALVGFDERTKSQLYFDERATSNESETKATLELRKARLEKQRFADGLLFFSIPR